MKEFTNSDAQWAKEKVDSMVRIASMLCGWEMAMHSFYDERRAQDAINQMMRTSPQIATLMLEIKVNARKKKNGN